MRRLGSTTGHPAPVNSSCLAAAWAIRTAFCLGRSVTVSVCCVLSTPRPRRVHDSAPARSVSHHHHPIIVVIADVKSKVLLNHKAILHQFKLPHHAHRVSTSRGVSVYASAVVSIHCLYPGRIGQAELTCMGGLVTHQDDILANSRCSSQY